jgi:N-acetylmuramoyl-L-alanine amidase
VLDAGHGGIDPGATGISGQHEKHVTLDMAMRVAALLEERGDIRVVLTRETDTYLRLRDRVAVARREAADLFLSLHADSYPEAWLRGASVYTVSDRASDRAAALLAQQENRADLVAGVPITDSDDATASILIDLAHRQSRTDSLRMAGLLVDALGQETSLIPDAHRHAGFVVLKAPDVPSVLVELGYLSNAEDDRLLGTAEYRDRLARALVRAIDAYFAGDGTVARG